MTNKMIGEIVIKKHADWVFQGDIGKRIPPSAGFTREQWDFSYLLAKLSGKKFKFWRENSYGFDITYPKKMQKKDSMGRLIVGATIPRVVVKKVTYYSANKKSGIPW